MAWAEAKNAPPKSTLGKALHYLRAQWSYLIRYLEDGRLEISNNLAAMSIKPFVIGRKNFLFATTPNGALQSHRNYQRERAGPVQVSDVGADPGAKAVRDG